MFSTSNDILNIALTIFVGALTFFVCWCIYYLISIIRDVKKITKDASDKMKKVDEIIDKIHDKIDKTSSNIGLLTEVIKRGIGVFLNWREDKGCCEDEKKDKKKRK
ncbi:MAG: hypothetical protein V1688_01000 [bacterium]